MQSSDAKYDHINRSIEHAYRQSMPHSYGLGLGMMGGMGGGMGINNLPGAPTLLYGRGMGYNGVGEPIKAPVDDR